MSVVLHIECSRMVRWGPSMCEVCSRRRGEKEKQILVQCLVRGQPDMDAHSDIDCMCVCV